jgi:hypothetical protein
MDTIERRHEAAVEPNRPNKQHLGEERHIPSYLPDSCAADGPDGRHGNPNPSPAVGAIIQETRCHFRTGLDHGPAGVSSDNAEALRQRSLDRWRADLHNGRNNLMQILKVCHRN